MMLSLLFLTLVVLSLTAPVQAQHPATLSFKGQGLEVYSLVPYNSGVVLLIGNATSFYVYFVNSTTQRILYYHSVNATDNSIPIYYFYSALTAYYAFTFNNSLYVVKYFSLGGTADVMVFDGLKLARNITLNVLTLKPVGGPLYNVSAMKMVCGPFIYTGIVTNETRFPFYPTELIFSSTNITVPGSLLAALQLHNGTFIMSDYFWPFLNNPEKRLLYLMFFNGDQLVWNRTYLVYTPNEYAVPLYLQGLESFVSAHFYTVIGDTVLVINVTSVRDNYANFSVLEVNINDGEIIGKVGFTSATKALGIFDIGEKPYVLAVSGDALTVSELTDNGLVKVAEVPIFIRNETVTSQLGGKNVTSTVRTPLTSADYVYGDYLVFLNPSGDGTNVTVVNPINVTSYVIDGKAEFYNGSLLVNSTNNFSIVLLNAFGIPVRVVDLGSLPPSYHPSVQVFTEGTKYYVVEEAQINNVTTVNVTVVDAGNLTGSPPSSTASLLLGQNVISPHGMSRAYLAVVLALAAVVVIATTVVLRRP
mgnify:CR=1 FL=1